MRFQQNFAVIDRDACHDLIITHKCVITGKESVQNKFQGNIWTSSFSRRTWHDSFLNFTHYKIFHRREKMNFCHCFLVDPHFVIAGELCKFITSRDASTALDDKHPAYRRQSLAASGGCDWLKLCSSSPATMLLAVKCTTASLIPAVYWSSSLLPAVWLRDVSKTRRWRCRFQ